MKNSFFSVPENTSSQESENINVQRTFWAAIIFTAVALISFMFSFFLINRSPVWQVYVITVITAIALVIDIISMVLIWRGQTTLGLKLLFWSTMFTVPPNALLVTNTTPFLIGIVLMVGFVHVFYLQPRSWRTAHQFVPIIASLLMLLVEAFQPIFRLNLTNQGISSNYFGPIILVFLVISLLVLVVRQTWSGNIRVKFVASFTTVALVAVGVVGYGSYTNYQRQIRVDIRQRLLNVLSLVAINQDGDLHATIHGPENAEDESHKKILAQNVNYLATDPDLKYIYTMRKNEQGQIYFVINARQGGEPGDPIGTIYNEPSDLLRTQFDTLGSPVIENDLYTDVYGQVLASYAPFYRSDGTREGIIGVDMAAEKILAQERAALIQILVTTAIALVLVTGIGLYLGNVFTKPITNLSSVAQKVREGDLSVRARIESADEVGDLAQAFNTMTSQLQSTLQGLEQLVAARTQDLEIVAEVGTATATILDTDQLMQAVVDLTKERFNLYHSHIYLTDETGENLVLASGAGEIGRAMVAEKRSIPLSHEQSLVARAARERKGVTVNDVTRTSDFLPNPLLPDTRSELAVPMIVGGNVIGVFDIQSDQVGRFTESDINIQTTLAAQVATSVQNVRSFEQARSQANLESLVNAIGQKIQLATSVDDTLQVAVRELGLALGAEYVNLNIGRRQDGGSNVSANVKAADDSNTAGGSQVKND